MAFFAATNPANSFDVAIDRSRRFIATKSTKAILTLVPNLRPWQGEIAKSGTFLGVILGMFGFGLVGLLAVNIALTQDAIHIKDLKIQSQILNEEREALLRQITDYSSTKALATAALALGMKAGQAPDFLDLSPVPVSTPALAAETVGQTVGQR